MTPIPNYYDILSLNNHPKLTIEEIRAAYKRASLLTHPDRNPSASESERRQAHDNFQKVADAYYVLSDESRKKEYDRLLRNQQESSFNAQYQSFQNPINDPLQFFKSFFFNTEDSTTKKGQGDNAKPNPDVTFSEACKSACLLATFADVLFEDLLRAEMDDGNQGSSIWKYLGAASGGTLGYIIGNIPGLVIGTMGGNRLGAIRDAKGKSVCAVFTDLKPDQKAAILKALTLKVLGYALSKS